MGDKVFKTNIVLAWNGGGADSIECEWMVSFGRLSKGHVNEVIKYTTNYQEKS